MQISLPSQSDEIAKSSVSSRVETPFKWIARGERSLNLLLFNFRLKTIASRKVDEQEVEKKQRQPNTH